MARARKLSEATVRKLALALPGVEERPSYGTPGFRVRDKLFARIHPKEPAVVVRVGLDEREVLMEADPETYYITDHYQNSPFVLVHLGHVEAGELGEVLTEAWYALAGKRLIAQHEAD